MKNKLDKTREKAVLKLAKTPVKNRQEFFVVQRKIAKKYSVGLMSSQEIIKIYQNLLKRKKIERNTEFEKLIRKRAIRTMSGIAPVAVLTKPYPCPGKCAYCPSEKDVPKSYLSNEPAVMRAIRCDYNPYAQVQDRLRALVANGHEPTKIELIVIGGTWSYLPKKYQYWYVLNLFAGANRFRIKNKKLKIKNYKYPLSLPIKKLRELLLQEQRKNEKAKYKIIGLTLETRPDYINRKELDEMRQFGCTRVEIGVQTLDDEILKLNKRGHGIKAIVDATKLLKNYGFKVTYHIMPGLPGATPAKDFKMFKSLFNDERFQPDQIKFYPCVVTKGSLLYRWWKQGKYKPYTDKQLQNLIIKCKKEVPEYVRIIRLIRDIPGESIIAGNKVTNLRQIMQNKGIECKCIRCRECKNQLKIKNHQLKIIYYQASLGKECFISYESEDGKILYGFCRLRLNSKVALVRELHVYGELASVGEKQNMVQHSGLGKKLLKQAEEIAKDNKHNKIKIISGVGVRGYYRKLKYRLNKTYMVKNI
ncbi:MAG: tRNA uridine(34) 5-carboxymethylaminomethyl modification radical SAM/GNAT enzyme Elp3 [Patescibacteria group bacterium]|nr:tRNA uridine(34) 5-carboxymethylaminomethyl modification radical SAM/GNAT enzyme Elp3 [Patescibacteria group bacterium]